MSPAHLTSAESEPASEGIRTRKLPPEQYVRLVRDSGLVEIPRLKALLTEFRDTFGERIADSEFLAERLVEARAITLWQNQIIVEGRYSSLFGGNHSGFFLGSYKLLSHLGTGGMNSVFLAEHTVMRRLVAIKVLTVRGDHDREFLDRFRRESRAIAALDHPNIVRAHDFNNDGDVYYLVMEYVEGKDLHHYVKERGPLPFSLAADFVRQAAEGLQHAHKAGLVHRDIKPANLLVDRKKVVKLLDLGIARLDEGEAGTSQNGGHQILGTADYLSPEQAIDCHNVDFRADIYSLGCTLYFLLTGRPPFGKGTIAQRMLAHQMHEAPPIFDDRPNAPPGLVAVCQQMMAKKPEDRYRSATEVAQALAGWANDFQAEGEEEQLPGSGRLSATSDTYAGSGSGTTLGRGSVRKKVPSVQVRSDEKVTCRTCGTDFGRYMYRSKCPKCGTVNHPLTDAYGQNPSYAHAEPYTPPPTEAEPTVARAADPNVKASCPSCGTTFTARWTKCLCCGAATVLHGPASVSTTRPIEEETSEMSAEATSSERTRGAESSVSVTDRPGAPPRRRAPRAADAGERSASVSAETSGLEPISSNTARAEARARARRRTPQWVVAVIGVLIFGSVILVTLAATGEPSHVVETYPDGSKKVEGVLVDGHKVGPWAQWSEQGQVLWRGEYQAGKRVGNWYFFNEQGQIISTGRYDDDRQHGLWMYRYDDGQLRSSGEYEDGQEHGSWVFYHPNGLKALEGDFDHGVRVGMWNVWDTGGELVGTKPAREVETLQTAQTQSSTNPGEPAGTPQ